jgi:hypothetical protein
MKHVCKLFGLVFVAVAIPAPATVLQLVPRQGGMLMPEVSYHADTDSVTVDLSGLYDQYNNPIIAQLTPLLVSHPSDRFDPEDPWYAFLDPSQQGRAFSRRYGFDMDPTMIGYVPENRALWIRNLGSSPELSFYDYMDEMYNPAGTGPTWNPILGTAGTSNAVYWNQGMWHLGVTAPPAPPGTTNQYSATVEIFVVNTDTGAEIPNSSTGPFLLRWTAVPDGRPELAIRLTSTNTVLVTWPASAVNWSLVSATNLTTATWSPNAAPVTINNNQASVVISNAAPQQFFRLQHLP